MQSATSSSGLSRSGHVEEADASSKGGSWDRPSLDHHFWSLTMHGGCSSEAATRSLVGRQLVQDAVLAEVAIDARPLVS